ncbi:MAG: hypothetical protein ACTHXC_00505 [Brachybacterium sp.]
MCLVEGKEGSVEDAKVVMYGLSACYEHAHHLFSEIVARGRTLRQVLLDVSVPPEEL